MPRHVITLLLADDHPPLRAGLRTLFEQYPDIEVVGEAENGDEVLPLVERLRPDILLLDLIMPGMRPAEIEKQVRMRWPETSTLILTGHSRDAYLAEMMAAGVSGFLEKNESGEKLVESIRNAASGTFLYTEEQIERVRNWRTNVEDKLNSLTKRERQVLVLIAQGEENAAIAERLCITSKTVEYHITRILKRLNLPTRQKAAAWVHLHFPDGLHSVTRIK